MTLPAGQVLERSDFWSSAPGSARWTVQLRNNNWRTCYTQGKTFLKKLKKAIDRTVTVNDNGLWNATWTRRFVDAARRAGYRQVPFVDTQTIWTPEMLRFAIWWTYYRGQIGTTSVDAVILPPSDRLVLPRSGEPPPDDGSAGTMQNPVCVDPGAPGVQPVPETPPPPPPPPTPSQDFSSSDFWSATPNSARWIVRRANGDRTLCATQARTFLRKLKSDLAVAPNLNDPGTWTAEETRQLYREIGTIRDGLLPRIVEANPDAVPLWGRDITAQLPFSETQTNWTPEMLRYAIWYAYYRNDSDTAPSYIELPDQTQLPRSNAAPPNDGRGTTLTPPACVPVSVTAAPSEPSGPAVFPPTPGSPEGSLGAVPRSSATAARSMSRLKILTTVAVGMAIGVYLGKR